jgi:glycosyltransferase involved in cell wall biosynthesis
MENLEKKIILAIPCHNEQLTIEKVINDFRKEIPGVEILVIDNNSSDKTAEKAKNAGAKVVYEKKQGKGFAVQKAFDEFDGDVLVLVDGDDTYPASYAKSIIEPVLKEDAEMVVGSRIHISNSHKFSLSHWLGNKFLTKSLNFLFRTELNDMESGFRAIDRKFVESSALLAGGFGIEPELTIQAIEKGFRIKEIPISVELRNKESNSKLNAFKDGTIVLYTIVALFRDYKPLQFFALLSLVSFILSVALGWYGVRDYIHTGIVNHIPSLIIAGFFAISGLINFIAGLILSSIKRRHDELLVILRRIRKN